MNLIKLIICIFLLLAGLFTYLSATLGVGRFNKAMSRIHASAMGDTLGLFCILLSLIIWKGPGLASLKMAVVLIFFWFASPVCSHIIAQTEASTNEDLGDLEVLGLDDETDSDGEFAPDDEKRYDS